MEILDEWDENVGIIWWKEARIKLNKIIRNYNNWVENHSENKVKTAKLLSKIDNHLQMKYCNQDGGSGYKNELLKIKNIVEEKLKSEKY